MTSFGLYVPLVGAGDKRRTHLPINALAWWGVVGGFTHDCPDLTVGALLGDQSEGIRTLGLVSVNAMPFAVFCRDPIPQAVAPSRGRAMIQTKSPSASDSRWASPYSFTAC